MTSAAGEFVAYGPSYWSVIAVFAVGAVVLVRLGRRQTATAARRFGRIGGALTALIYAGASVNALVPPGIGWSVPLHLTDLATVAAAYALWSQRQWAYALTYYWGLVLSTQALISPVLTGPDFPHYQFLGFWLIHLFVVWAAIYLTWGRGMRPTWRSYRIALTVTGVWAVITITFNSIAGTNYGFLNRKPGNASLLDLMGPWPVYLLIGAALVAVVWAAMTWPWSLESPRATGDQSWVGDNRASHGDSVAGAAQGDRYEENRKPRRDRGEG
ncbi:MAG: TIGR02206 family membrane protein [Actinomycetia bacterium]|nr:TIGR02206 family membrane protein [Actinomycetes bacterium]MCH9762351.1 TIGR02206 family membrane protein [Actinomycetes bacterium]